MAVQINTQSIFKPQSEADLFISENLFDMVIQSLSWLVCSLNVCVTALFNKQKIKARETNL